MVNFFSAAQNVFLALQGETEAEFVAAAFALGAVLGLLPAGNLVAVIVLLLLFFFQVNKSLALVAIALFTGVGYALDRPAHWIGYALLTAGFLRPLWTWLYNLPIVPWTRFNNTIVLGNLVIGLVLYYPLYRLVLRAIAAYRTRWKAVIDQWPIVRAINGWGWIQTGQGYYQKWRSLKR